MKLGTLLYCLLGGLVMAIPALQQGGFGWWWLSGIVMSASFVPVAYFGPRSALGQFGVIAPVLLIVTSFCTWTEALIFAPVPEIQEHAVQNLLGGSVIFLILAAALSVLARGLKLAHQSNARVERRSPLVVVLLLAASGCAYAFYYLVFGSLTYHFFTWRYYPHALEDVAKLGPWFWPIEIGRGALMAAAVLPVLYTLRASRAQTAIAVGSLLWIAGGLGPLLIPNALMGATQRFIHVIEIFTQNAPLGATAALLLRRGTIQPADPKTAEHD